MQYIYLDSDLHSMLNIVCNY